MTGSSQLLGQRPDESKTQPNIARKSSSCGSSHGIHFLETIEWRPAIAETDSNVGGAKRDSEPRWRSNDPGHD